MRALPNGWITPALLVREPVILLGHKESDMSEATNDQHIKIYTADG